MPILIVRIVAFSSCTRLRISLSSRNCVRLRSAMNSDLPTTSRALPIGLAVYCATPLAIHFAPTRTIDWLKPVICMAALVTLKPRPAALTPWRSRPRATSAAFCAPRSPSAMSLIQDLNCALTAGP